jgi:peptidoglycan/xylan/chitin deacetylase (PgdA/CDA1 family)
MSGLAARLRLAAKVRVTRHWTPHALRNRATAPIASFSFDDFPRSAANEGAAILESCGVKATFFVCGGRMGRHAEGLEHYTESELVALARAGHEIGCHTFSHLRMPGASRRDIGNDIARNAHFITERLGDYRMSSFAYPYGDVTIRTKAIAGKMFPICRGIDLGVNKGRIDFAQLRGVPLRQPFDAALVRKALDDAAANKAWVIFFTHDVSDDPHEYGCRPGELREAIAATIDRGIEILPMKHAAAKTRFC